MIYIITASYGEYDSHCATKVYATDDLDNARDVMRALQQALIEAMNIITVVGTDAVANCSEAIWSIAHSAHWDGRVYLSISSMELGVVSDGATFLEGVYAESAYEFMYNRDMNFEVDENSTLNKYEVLAFPYEAKYYGYRH